MGFFGDAVFFCLRLGGALVGSFERSSRVEDFVGSGTGALLTDTVISIKVTLPAIFDTSQT